MAKLYLLKKKREESSAILEKLSQIDLVRQLPPEEMEDVLLCVQPCRFAAGDIIFNQGDRGDALYFIDAGQVDIGVSSDTEKSRKIATLTTGHSFGEMALLTGTPVPPQRWPPRVCRCTIDKVRFDELIGNPPPGARGTPQLPAVVQNVQAAGSAMDAAHWQQVAIANIQQLSRNEESPCSKQATTGTADHLSRAMLDGIPDRGLGSSFRPRRLSVHISGRRFSPISPRQCISWDAEAGFSKRRIFHLWGGLIVAGALPQPAATPFFSATTVLTFMEAYRHGIHTMVASVMMPEAYEHGGAVGLSTIAGFLAAFLFSFQRQRKRATAMNLPFTIHIFT